MEIKVVGHITHLCHAPPLEHEESLYADILLVTREGERVEARVSGDDLIQAELAHLRQAPFTIKGAVRRVQLESLAPGFPYGEWD